METDGGAPLARFAAPRATRPGVMTARRTARGTTRRATRGGPGPVGSPGAGDAVAACQRALPCCYGAAAAPADRSDEA
jgi:hypothetical protein